MSSRRRSPSPRRAQAPDAAADARVRLVPDGDGRGGVTVLIDGVASSHLDPDDPLRLDFEYMRWMGDALDLLLPDGPVSAVHLGAAGCTLARYVEATRPGSRQVAVESDGEVIAAVREGLGLRSTARLRIREGDGRAVLADLAGTRPHGYDVVIRDAFLDAVVPAHLTTVEYVDLVAAALSPRGLYLANVGDVAGLPRTRQEAAAAAALGPVAVVAEPAQFKGGSRHGNAVLLAGPALQDADAVATLTRRLVSGAVRARLLGPDAIGAFAAGARAPRDASVDHDATH
ncbi:MAG: fused MFS/spermidine synthase [Kineosporiaceae bacterium]